MPHVHLLPQKSAAIAIAAANALAVPRPADDPPPYDIAVARLPKPGMIHNMYPDRTYAALSPNDPRWKVHPPTGVLPPAVLQELKEAIGGRPPAPAGVDAPRQEKTPQPSAPLLSRIGSGAESRSAALQQPVVGEKIAKRVQKTNAQQTLELLKKKRKLEARLRKLEGDLDHAKQFSRGAP